MPNHKAFRKSRQNARRKLHKEMEEISRKTTMGLIHQVREGAIKTHKENKLIMDNYTRLHNKTLKRVSRWDLFKNFVKSFFSEEPTILYQPKPTPKKEPANVPTDKHDSNSVGVQPLRGTTPAPDTRPDRTVPVLSHANSEMGHIAGDNPSANGE